MTQLQLWPEDAGQLHLFVEDEGAELRIRTAPAEMRSSAEERGTAAERVGVVVRSKTGQFCFLGLDGEPVELVDGDRLDVQLPGGSWADGFVQISEQKNRHQPTDTPLDFVATNGLRVRTFGGMQ